MGNYVEILNRDNLVQKINTEKTQLFHGDVEEFLEQHVS